MPKLTDEELGELLRETFADKEDLADSLPMATKRRHRVLPALLAAAAVLAVIAGVLVAADGTRRHDPAARPDTAGPDTAQTPFDENGLIWGAAIATVARNIQTRPGGWEAVQVLAEGAVFSAQATIRYSSPGPGQRVWPPPRTVFSTDDRALIERALRPIGAGVRWDDSPAPRCAAGEVATVTVGAVITRGSRRDVRVTLRNNCGVSVSGTYTLQRIDGTWQVVGGIGSLPCLTPPTSGPRPRAKC
ncbi:hypothetical protein GCM10009804_52860 [Kribbella hippodromi]|uniref:Uncharacterized protein n=1 Tax=Kribbella hippodromi TaxID=434347 RepID=A0ABN2DZU1_9ACTN